jgi:hypothetical protein
MPLGRTSRTKMSQRGERRTAEAAGGRVQPGSGSQWHAKADIKTPELLIERKDTHAAQYVLRDVDIAKLWAHAAKEGRTPVFAIGMCGRDLAVVDLQWLMDVLKGE